MTDREFDQCIEKMSVGDGHSLKMVYDEYHEMIYVIIYNVIRRKNDAEKLTADFFARLYKASSVYEPGAEHKKWIATIARNMALGKSKKTGKEMLTDDILSMADTYSNSSNDKNTLQRVALRRSITTLDHTEKEVIDLKLICGFGFRDIAEIIDKSVGTVTWNYDSAMKKLRRCKQWEQ